MLEFRATRGEPPTVEVHAAGQVSVTELKRIADWLLCTDLDLAPFYRVALPHPRLGPIIEQLHGLKPMRPATLFEMFVIAVTEQQISMVAAHHIRLRLVESYGDKVDGLYAFPTPERLSQTTIAELMRCGLSRHKAEYVMGLADKVASGGLDLDHLQTLSDEEVRTVLLQERGLGPWSVDYILVRGLNRPDRVPADDLGIRTIVGDYLGSGQRLTAHGAMRKLSPFRPYRGLAVFYLLAHARLQAYRE